MVYIVIAPARTFSGLVQDCAVFATDDLSEAKQVALSNRQHCLRKGYKTWASRVKLLSPKTPEAYDEMANKLAAYGHELDIASNGNSFKGCSLIDWANTLRIRADELADPESYADL